MFNTAGLFLITLNLIFTLQKSSYVESGGRIFNKIVGCNNIAAHEGKDWIIK